MATEKKATVVEVNDKVTVELFQDGSEKYSQPVSVTINGITTVIERGKPVQVSRDVADVLETSMAQDKYTFKLTKGLAEEFEKKTASEEK